MKLIKRNLLERWLFEPTMYRYSRTNLMRTFTTAFTGIAIALLGLLTGCGEKADVSANKGTVVPAPKVSPFPQQFSIDFAKDPFPKEVISATGLSNPEPWGRWTDGEKVVLTFNSQLPQNFSFELTVSAAFGPNSNTPTKLKIGEFNHTFSVSKPGEIFVVPVTHSGVTKTLEITPPKPTSPKSLGISNDSRQLGLGLVKLRIVQQ
jgi:hypothetical protein